jgi:hypothetical protein
MGYDGVERGGIVAGTEGHHLAAMILGVAIYSAVGFASPGCWFPRDWRGISKKKVFIGPGDFQSNLYCFGVPRFFLLYIHLYPTCTVADKMIGLSVPYRHTNRINPSSSACHCFPRVGRYQTNHIFGYRFSRTPCCSSGSETYPPDWEKKKLLFLSRAIVYPFRVSREIAESRDPYQPCIRESRLVQTFIIQVFPSFAHVLLWSSFGRGFGG